MSSTHTARVAPERTESSARLAAVFSPAERLGKRMATYFEMLKDPRWQKRRLERLADARWECTNCGDAESTLHVHHLRYVKGRAPWEYTDPELAVLCETCHGAAHDDKKLLERMAIECGSQFADFCIGAASGYFAAQYSLSPELEEEAKEGRELYFELGVGAAVLETLGVEDWRALIRYCASLKNPGPFLLNLVERWDVAAEQFRAMKNADQ